MIKSIARMTPSDYDRLRDQLEKPTAELVEKLTQRIGEFLSGFRGSSSDPDLIYEVVSELTAANAWKKIPVNGLLSALKNANGETRKHFLKFIPNDLRLKILDTEKKINQHSSPVRALSVAGLDISEALSTTIFTAVKRGFTKIDDRSWGIELTTCARSGILELKIPKTGGKKSAVGFRSEAKYDMEKIDEAIIHGWRVPDLK